MKKLIIFLALLISLQGFGQTVLRSGSTVLTVYDSQQPLNIETTCEGWYDGDNDQSFTLDGTSVDRWWDLSGNDRHLNNTNADATRPTYDINTGRVTFTAANSTFLQSAAFGAALAQPNTVFIVTKMTGGDEYAIDGVTTLTQIIASVAGNFRIYAGAWLIDGVSNTNYNIHCGLFNGVNSNHWVNGVSGGIGNAGTRGLDGITLGTRGDLGSPSDVEIKEVIVFGADISDVDRDKITGYLANKWDITATTDFKGYVLRQD